MRSVFLFSRSFSFFFSLLRYFLMPYHQQKKLSKLCSRLNLYLIVFCATFLPSLCERYGFKNFLKKNRKGESEESRGFHCLHSILGENTKTHKFVCPVWTMSVSFFFERGVRNVGKKSIKELWNTTFFLLERKKSENEESKKLGHFLEKGKFFSFFSIDNVLPKGDYDWVSFAWTHQQLLPVLQWTVKKEK